MAQTRKEIVYLMGQKYISSKKWCDKGGGRGFGWKQNKVKKYICITKLETEKIPRIQSNTTSTYDEKGAVDRFGDDIAEGKQEHTTTTLCNNDVNTTWGLGLALDK